MEIKLTSKLVYQTIFKVLCLMGCVYQSLRISKLYFSYETITNVKYESENRIDLPGITFCYNKLNQIKHEYKAKFINESVEHLQNLQNHEINRLTIQEQLEVYENYPRQFSDLMLYTGYTPLFSRRIINSTKITNSFDMQEYCFTMFDEQGGKYTFDRIDYGLKSPIIAKVILLRPKIEIERDLCFTVKLQDKNDRVLKSDSNHAIKTISSDCSMLAYRKTAIKYMFEPKGKECTPHQSREGCFIDCKTNEFIKLTDK